MVINLPKTMTDLTIGTWMLSGDQVVKNGTIIRRGYVKFSGKASPIFSHAIANFE